MKHRLPRLTPRTVGGQMAALFSLALVLLMAMMVALEVARHETVEETVLGERTRHRLQSLAPLLASVPPDRLSAIIALTSTCHEGYSVSDTPFSRVQEGETTTSLLRELAQTTAIDPDRLRVGRALLDTEDFAYALCPPGDIQFPIKGVVISLVLDDGRWLNIEVHPHEWHVAQILGWTLRAGGLFLLTGIITLLLLRRLSRPLERLTKAAQRFGRGLEVQPVEPDGPEDVRTAVEAFNTMQSDVAETMRRRTLALAAISHDLRTPLTALRLRAELVEDRQVRDGLAAGISRLDRVVASALGFLRSEATAEPAQNLDLTALVESECEDFIAAGEPVTMQLETGIQITGHGELLARAVRNLVDNAVKHGESAAVELGSTATEAAISVSDLGPGVKAADRARMLRPFERLSHARADAKGGMGLGLAVVEAAVRAHGGRLEFESNHPSGLIVHLRLPLANR